MTRLPTTTARFRADLAGGRPLLGTFVKMPTTQAIEILGSVGFDFVVIDQEHAPLDRSHIDLMCLAARASGVAPVVRVGDPGDANVLFALDCGAAGIMFPHVTSAQKARAIVQSCRYAGGRRGFAGMTRAADWGRRTTAQHIAAQDAEIAVIAMIEDPGAVDAVADIVATEGLDAVFIGRGDLGAAFATDSDATTRVADLTARIAAATIAAGKPVLMLVGSTADASAMRALGARTLLVSSDHNFLKSAAAAAVRDYAGGD